MTDRFKFRAYITTTVCRDTAEEKQVGFYVEDVAVYFDGDIGFSREDLTNTLSKLDLTETQKSEIEKDIFENSYSGDYDWFSISFGIVEQCTGLKDKNGKFIYEGDVILVEDKYKCPVEWEAENARYNVVGYGEIAYLSYNEMEVIDNIHTGNQKETKNVSTK